MEVSLISYRKQCSICDPIGTIGILFINVWQLKKKLSLGKSVYRHIFYLSYILLEEDGEVILTSLYRERVALLMHQSLLEEVALLENFAFYLVQSLFQNRLKLNFFITLLQICKDRKGSTKFQNR